MDGTERSYQAIAVPCAQNASVRKVKIAPNPNDGLFALQFEGEMSEEPVEIRVLNALGVEVARQSFNASGAAQVKMDLTGFATGIYQVLVGTDGEAPAQSFKVLVK
jgi:hypothetical protein